MTTLTPSRALAALALLLVALPALAQSPVGTWRTIDDETRQPRSIVRVYERSGQLFGEIVRLLPEGTRCVDCAGQYDGQDLRGFQILSGFRANGTRWEGGRIVDPKSGRTYRAKMEVQRDGRLKLWGYVGMDTPLTRRSQHWERVR